MNGVRDLCYREWRPPGTNIVVATEVGGTHPTGMHSCFKLHFKPRENKPYRQVNTGKTEIIQVLYWLNY